MIIKIGADLGPAIAETGKLSNALDDVSKSVRGAASSFAQIAPPLSTVSKSVEKIAPAARGASAELDRFRNASRGAADAQKILPPSLDKTAKAFSRITPGANAAGFALTNVGRVAQDLPFGFIGIQNNLNPLLESFQRLKAETGSSRAALKALGSSLIGAGGIGLALSLVSSAILIFQNGIGGFNKKTKEAKESADELAKSIRSIGSIEGEASAGVQGQLAQVNALASAVADSNVPYEQRKRALEELKEINKAYFNDLKIEDAATGQLTKTVEEYTKALVNSAIQKQFVDEIAKVAKAQVDAETEITKSTDKVTRARQKVVEFTKLDNATQRVGVTTNNASANARRELAKAEEELAKANDKVTQLQEQRLVVEDRLNKAVAAGLALKDLNVDKGKKEEDLLKKRLDALEKIRDATEDATTRVGLQEAIFELQVKIALRDQGKNQLSKGEVDKQIQGFKRELQDEFDKQAIEMEAIPKVRFSQVIRAEIPTDIESKIAKATGLDKKIPEITLHDVRVKLLGVTLTNAIEESERIAKLLQDTLLTGITNTLQGTAEAFGNALGEIFSGGDIGSAFAKAAQAILSLIGGVLQEVGKQIVATSALVKALKESLKTLFANPAAGIAVGIALIAAGSFLKNLKLPGFKDGGWATGPKSGYLAVLHGNELIIPENKVKQASTTGVQGSALDMPIILQPSVAIQGQALRILLNRVDATNGRLF